jgi:hypothetical protein
MDNVDLYKHVPLAILNDPPGDKRDGWLYGCETH